VLAMGVDDLCPLIESSVTGQLGCSFSSFSPHRVLALQAMPVAPALSLPSTLEFS